MAYAVPGPWRLAYGQYHRRITDTTSSGRDPRHVDHSRCCRLHADVSRSRYIRKCVATVHTIRCGDRYRSTRARSVQLQILVIRVRICEMLCCAHLHVRIILACSQGCFQLSVTGGAIAPQIIPICALGATCSLPMASIQAALQYLLPSVPQIDVSSTLILGGDNFEIRFSCVAVTSILCFGHCTHDAVMRMM